MKTMLISDFVHAINSAENVQHVEVTMQFNRADEDDRQIPHSVGFATNSIEIDDFTLCYLETFNYDDLDPESLSAGIDGQEYVWKLEGVTVYDEDGDTVDADVLGELYAAHLSDIDYSAITG